MSEARPRPIWDRITLEHLWLGVPLFVLVVKGFLVPLPLLDFWWHLKMGEIIVSTHAIPRTDIFSFTAAGQPYIVQNWLAEIIYYATYRLGGFPLLVFLNTALLALALLPVYLLCLEVTERKKVAVLAAFLASFVFFGNMRPQVFSFVLFAWFYWVLEGYRTGRRDRLWVLPVLMIFWVNLHGAFVLGLGLTVLYLVVGMVPKLVGAGGDRDLSGARLRKLGLVLAACLAATLVNPEGYKLYDYVRVVMTDPSSQQFVAEWQPPTVNSAQGFLTFYGLFFLSILVFVYARQRPDLMKLALFFVFSFFGLMATRNTIWFGIVIPPVLALHMPGTIGSSAPAPPRRFNALVAAVAAAVLVILSPWVRPALYSTSLLEPQTPVAAMDYIDRHDLRGHIFHPQVFGDYLAWRLYPRQKSFFDGRVHLFGESLVREYRNIFHDSHWEERLRPFEIRYLLLSKDPGQEDSVRMIGSARASKNWTVLFEDKVAILMECRASTPL